MKLTVKKLQGDECSLDVLPSTLISEIKLDVQRKLGIPVGQQRLLLLGRTLADDNTVASYTTIKDGTKLNLVVKKPDTFYEAAVKYFKKAGMSNVEASNAANRLITITQKKFDMLSWDDIERLAYDCLLSEGINSTQDNRMNMSF